MKIELFKEDSKHMKILSKIVDGVILNILFLISCIPVLTIGPAFTAFYYASVKVIRRERGYMFKTYVKGFKDNIKLSGIIWLLTLLVNIICLGGIYFVFISASMLTKPVSIVLIAIYGAIMIFVFCAGIYIYPALSRFKMNLKNALKLMVIMPLSHPGKTLALFAITIVFTALMLLSFYKYVIFIFVFPELYILGISLIMENILLEYISDVKEEE